MYPLQPQRWADDREYHFERATGSRRPREQRKGMIEHSQPSSTFVLSSIEYCLDKFKAKRLICPGNRSRGSRLCRNIILLKGHRSHLLMYEGKEGYRQLVVDH